MTGESEASIIHDLFAPLAKAAPGALALGDDVALIESANIAITKDLMIAGVHFRRNDPLDLVAQKLLRVNISDLVAKGVRPGGYLLGCVWPANVDRAMIELFTHGLAKDQALFKCHLLGGDTTRHRAANAPLTLSATFYGAVPEGGIMRRDGAKAGDDLYVTGTIGDAGLGLKLLATKSKIDPQHRQFLQERYWLPQPRVTFGSALGSFASAACDISDGLIGDAHHLATQSAVRITLDLEAIPLSQAAAGWCEGQRTKPDALEFLASCGDDYEILFTVPAALRRSVMMAAKASRTEVTRIGTIRRGEGVRVTCGPDLDITVKTSGFDHFA